MVRVKSVLVVLGALFVLGAVGCNEPKLKERITLLEGEKSRLNAALSEREAQLAQASQENSRLGAENVAVKADLERERGKRIPMPGPDLSEERHQTTRTDKTADGWMRTSVGDRLTLGGHMLFSPGNATLTGEGRNALNKVASDLKSHYSGRTIRVYGFTDSSPITKTKNLWEDNLDLSANRSMAVVRYLWSHGVPKDRIEAVAMGDAHPLASNGTAEGKKKNRRVEIFVIRR
ncbi:MAG: OmpA family protein [Planctomycetota bacterium]|nr:OmpA family protein [Planctomycetota bacterium]